MLASWDDPCDFNYQLWKKQLFNYQLYSRKRIFRDFDDTDMLRGHLLSDIFRLDLIMSRLNKESHKYNFLHAYLIKRLFRSLINTERQD